jgi:hypothetical protein
MAAPLLTVASVVNCPHAAKATFTPSQTKVLAGGSPVLVQTDAAAIAGCAFTIPGPKPSPCTTIRWTVAALRVTAGGTPVLHATSVGLCNSPEQAPQGPPLVTTQPRVTAT